MSHLYLRLSHLVAMRRLGCGLCATQRGYEHQRYFDCRRWMTAKDEFNGQFYGMNTAAPNDAVGGEFWKRAKLTKDNGQYGKERKFTDRCYFFPIPYDESKIVKGFTQNYGW